MAYTVVAVSGAPSSCCKVVLFLPENALFKILIPGFNRISKKQCWVSSDFRMLLLILYVCFASVQLTKSLLKLCLCGDTKHWSLLHPSLWDRLMCLLFIWDDMCFGTRRLLKQKLAILFFRSFRAYSSQRSSGATLETSEFKPKCT